jgi:hypothetical protein
MNESSKGECQREVRVELTVEAERHLSFDEDAA